jgi:hypothetical protein
MLNCRKSNLNAARSAHATQQSLNVSALRGNVSGNGKMFEYHIFPFLLLIIFVRIRGILNNFLLKIISEFLADVEFIFVRFSVGLLP